MYSMKLLKIAAGCCATFPGCSHTSQLGSPHLLVSRTGFHDEHRLQAQPGGEHSEFEAPAA